VVVTLAELLVADPPEAWRAAGFTVDADGTCRVGTVRVRLVGRDRGAGIVGWTLSGLPSGPHDGLLDGIPTGSAPAHPTEPAAHPNGAVRIDHVVVLSPDLARTTAALREVGLDVRRERDGVFGDRAVRQVFFRLGEVILELVGSPEHRGDGPSQLWGITHTVADVDAAAAALGERASAVKDAVQPGRRITTLRHHALGMSVRTALISPPPKRPAQPGRDRPGP